MEIFDQYQNFTDIKVRKNFKEGIVDPKVVVDFQTRPVGKYELNDDKMEYTKTSFWAI